MGVCLVHALMRTQVRNLTFPLPIYQCRQAGEHLWIMSRSLSHMALDCLLRADQSPALDPGWGDGVDVSDRCMHVVPCTCTVQGGTPRQRPDWPWP